PMPSTPDSAPMGATLNSNGATFRTWAPSAQQIHVHGDFNGWTDAHPLQRISNGHWFAQVDGVKEGANYKFFVVGNGSTGYKRDPYARALTRIPVFPFSNCIVTAPKTFSWHDAGF